MTTQAASFVVLKPHGTPFSVHSYFMGQILISTCQRLGVKLRITSRLEDAKPDVVIEDRTEKQIVVGDCLNGQVRSISKQKVCDLHKKHFGFYIDLDPRQHVGLAMEKKVQNAGAEYNVVTCPREPRNGYVYQHILGGPVTQRYRIEYQLHYFCGQLHLQELHMMMVPNSVDGHRAKKLKWPIVPVSTIYKTPEELAKLHAFLEEFGVDWARVDILVDERGRPVILDVNDTASAASVFIKDMIPYALPHMEQYVTQTLRRKQTGPLGT